MQNDTEAREGQRDHETLLGVANPQAGILNTNMSVPMWCWSEVPTTRSGAPT